MSSPNNNNEKNHLLNKLLNKPRIIKSFSVTKPDFITLATFMEISQREDPDFSTTIVKAMKEYNHSHNIPNPQATLTRSFNLGLPQKRKDLCCVPKCKRHTKYHLILSNYLGQTEVFPVCNEHKHWRHETFKFLQGVKPV